MTPLTIVSPQPDLATFGSAKRPIRPSRVAKLLACPMSVVLVMHQESEGNTAAQTGNLVHDAAEHFHNTKGTQEARIAAGLKALEAAREKFPEGDAEKARKIFGSYAADKENQRADVRWVEQQVRLTLPPDVSDPTQEEIVIEGTLDQVRLINGVLTVWDIKTGDYMSGDENVLEYLTQQAVYTLAARKSLHSAIEPGGLIYTPGYFKARSKVHLENPLTIEQCEDILLMVPVVVSLIRQGKPVFRPNKSNCLFCDVKKMGRPWPKCHSAFAGIYGKRD